MDVEADQIYDRHSRFKETILVIDLKSENVSNFKFPP